MENIHPKTILYILLSFLGLLVFSVLLNINDFYLRFPKLSSIVHQRTEKIAREKTRSFEQITHEVELIDLEQNQDTNSSISLYNLNSEADFNFEIPAEQYIHHPNDELNGLENFYLKLLSLKKDSSLVRVMHFGDSQIEGDRISGVLREKLQQIFGGCGVGFLPISENNFARKNILREFYGWEKYQIFGVKAEGSHNGYGLTGYYHRKMESTDEAWIKLKSNTKLRTKVKYAEVLSLLYGNLNGESTFEFKNNKGIIQSGVLNPSGKVNMENWDLNNFTKNEFQISLKGAASPDVYGIALDCKQGLAIDNISLRGSAGGDFTKMDKELLKAQFSKLNIGLIIYQFGVNVVPNEVAGYKYYENIVYAQLKLLKQLAPHASILVVSVSDMAKKVGDEIISYPNIPLVKQAQKNAAQRANCSFWDLHAVMGGENSIQMWSESTPPLAEKDYTHFSNQGSAWVGKKLFESIMVDYIQYKKLNGID